MLVVPGENIVAFDVDETLVMWSDKFSQPHENSIGFKDPYDDSTNYLLPHIKHIDLLKKYKGRGLTVIVWSAGGVEWARSVVKTLELETYVDLVITKPNKLVDDLTPSEIFPCRIYLNE